jgi:hypothetical protein
VDNGSGQSTIGSRPDNVAVFSLFHCASFVDVNDCQFCATLFLGDADMGHDIDLGVDGIAAPDNDQVRLLHLAGVNAPDRADTRRIARPRK